MFRSLLVAAAQRPQGSAGPPRANPGPGAAAEALEAQFSCPICLEVFHRAVGIAGCGHTHSHTPRDIRTLQGSDPGSNVLTPSLPDLDTWHHFCLAPFKSSLGAAESSVLWGMPAALPAGAIPAVPALPRALRSQKGGEGFQRGEAALVLQGSLQRLQQEGDLGQNALPRLILRQGAGADGQLPQVCSSCPHISTYSQQHSQPLDIRVSVLWGPEPGPAGTGEALHGKPQE
ncbi:E3 ubiquitin-protein ligase RNF166 isoform X2 [Pithys albifrons albifrons]|uniref:E3 ubiquitin-protein ligase RNF166 isoform X2 n=1 Tax=Pithys albifrons albifrons TaxID=3385563 RepID=UPI003A5CBE42